MKITRTQVKTHDDALALLSLSRALTADEREFVFRNYSPMAEQNVSRAAIFFTPFDLAWDFAVFGHGGDGCTYLDLGAGIGVLSYVMLLHEGRNAKRLVCVEINPELVEVGKKVLPEAEWYCRDIFERQTWRDIGSDFGVGISNPPYGRVASTREGDDWLVRAPAHIKAAEIILRTCQTGEMIVPENDVEYDMRRNKPQMSRSLASLVARYPGVHLSPESEDVSIYAAQWQGTTPNLTLAYLNSDDMFLPTPIGLN